VRSQTGRQPGVGVLRDGAGSPLGSPAAAGSQQLPDLGERCRLPPEGSREEPRRQGFFLAFQGLHVTSPGPSIS